YIGFGSHLFLCSAFSDHLSEHHSPLNKLAQCHVQPVINWRARVGRHRGCCSPYRFSKRFVEWETYFFWASANRVATAFPSIRDSSMKSLGTALAANAAIA